MADQWYLTRDNQKHGPYSSAQLKGFAKTGQLLPTDMIWKEGMQKWLPSSQVKGLFPQTSPNPVPQAAPQTPQPVPVVAKPLPAQSAGDPVQSLGDGTAPKAPAASLPSFVSKARTFFTTNWTIKKIAIVGGAAGGSLFLLVVLVIAMSGGGRPGSGSAPAVAKVDFDKGPNGEDVVKVEQKKRVFMAFRDKSKKTVRHGLFTEFYDDAKSKKKSEGNFFTGEWHGKVTRWYEDGQLRSERTYDRGKGVGTHKGYKKSGEIAWTVSFDRDGIPLIRNASTDSFVNQVAELIEKDTWETEARDGWIIHGNVGTPGKKPPVGKYTFTEHRLNLGSLGHSFPYSKLHAFLGPPHHVHPSPNKWGYVHTQVWIWECKDGFARFSIMNLSVAEKGIQERSIEPQIGDMLAGGGHAVWVGGDLNY